MLGFGGQQYSNAAELEEEEERDRRNTQFEEVRGEQTRAGSSPHQFDLSALAALSGQGEIPSGQEIVGAINAEDLEASFHTESSPGNNSLEEKNVDRQAGRPPPGFGGQQYSNATPQIISKIISLKVFIGRISKLLYQKNVKKNTINPNLNHSGQEK